MTSLCCMPLVHLFTTNVEVLSKEDFLTFAKEITQLDDGNSSTIHPLLIYPLAHKCHFYSSQNYRLLMVFF